MKHTWESLKGDAQTIVERLKTIVHEGNVRRVVINHDGRKVAEFPVTAGVLGAVIAPVLAAVAAIVAMLKDCTIEIERADDEDAKAPPRTAEG
jgi:hypothetical protein